MKKWKRIKPQKLYFFDKNIIYNEIRKVIYLLNSGINENKNILNNLINNIYNNKDYKDSRKKLLII